MEPAKSVSLDQLLVLDKIIHERVRLGIMAALSVSEPLTFLDLKQTLKVTDGNLSVHLRLLEKNSYVAVEKIFVARKPCSTYRLTQAGRDAFNEYIQQLERFIHKVHQEDISTK